MHIVRLSTPEHGLVVFYERGPLAGEEPQLRSGLEPFEGER
jgi:hypothetical protein